MCRLDRLRHCHERTHRTLAGGYVDTRNLSAVPTKGPRSPKQALELFALMRHHLAIFAEVPNMALDDELRRVLLREG